MFEPVVANTDEFNPINRINSEREKKVGKE
jgi:hypothetical protein